MTGADDAEDEDEDDELEATDPALSRGGASCDVGCRKRSGEASRSALSRSRSKRSIRKSIYCKPMDLKNRRCLKERLDTEES